MMAHAYNSRTQAMESGGSETEGHPQLHIKCDRDTERDPAKERQGERKEGRKRRRKGNREEGSDCLEKEGPALSGWSAGVTLSPAGAPPVIWEPPSLNTLSPLGTCDEGGPRQTTSLRCKRQASPVRSMPLGHCYEHRDGAHPDTKSTAAPSTQPSSPH